MNARRNEVIREYDNRPTAATELARKRIIERQDTQRRIARQHKLAAVAAYVLVFGVLPLSWALSHGWIKLPW